MRFDVRLVVIHVVALSSKRFEVFKNGCGDGTIWEVPWNVEKLSQCPRLNTCKSIDTARFQTPVGGHAGRSKTT